MIALFMYRFNMKKKDFEDFDVLIGYITSTAIEGIMMKDKLVTKHNLT